MVLKKILLAAAGAGALALLSLSAASAMPPTDRTLSVPSEVQQVQRRHWNRGWHGGWGPRRRGWHRHGWRRW
jgi:hypothetical protein